jgi:Holliday junction resolvase-like predicted endonuclease
MEYQGRLWNVQNVRDRIAAASICERIFQISLKKTRFPEGELEGKHHNGANLGGILDDLSSDGILKHSGDEIEVINRLGLAEILVKSGRSVEALSQLLGWREFERFCRKVLEANGFDVRSNIRFTVNKKRHEIDLVAAKRPYLLFIDCKHWRPGAKSRYVKAALKQRFRMEAALKKESVLGLGAETSLSSFQRFSLIVSLADVTTQWSQTTQVVPIFRLNSFLTGLDQFCDELSIESLGGSVLENWVNS